MLFRSLLLLSVVIATPVWAVDFRIETKVYSGEETTPISQNTTLFQNGVIYDFAETSKQVAIYRHGKSSKSGTFLLLDSKRLVRTEIDASRIDARLEKMNEWAGTQPNPLLRFASDPKFEETFDEESGVLTLASKQMTYELATVSQEHNETNRDLKNYFNEFAKLNWLLSSSMPPGARLEVNKALARRNLVPVEVSVKLGIDDKPTLRAEHLFTWRLSKEDRARIELVGEQLVEFKKVTNLAFRAAQQPAETKTK